MNELTVPVGAQDHTQGAPNAEITLLEYGDYQCPSCRHAATVVKRVQKHFGDRLRFVFRHFPLEQHPFAEPAAEAAEFAASQGKFWEMHDALYDNQARLGDELFTELATSLGLDPAALSQSLRDRTFAGRIETDRESGEASGVRGTPSFYLNTDLYSGEYDAPALIEAIDAALRG